MATKSISPQTASASLSARQFDDLVAEVVVLLESGKPVDLDCLLAECPQHREQLERLLPTG